MWTTRIVMGEKAGTANYSVRDEDFATRREALNRANEARNSFDKREAKTVSILRLPGLYIVGP